MRSPAKTAAVLKKMEGVADKLAGPRLKQKQRLELLRRQAELGDQRDEIALQQRRSPR